MSNNPFDDDYVAPEPPIAGGSEPKRGVGLKVYDDLIQGSDEWLQARLGLITASEMKLLLTTKTLKECDNDKVRQHVYQIAYQRISRFIDPQYVSDAMLRGQDDEIYARLDYEKHYAPVAETGFITNDQWGFTIGYSPDGLVGDDGAIEVKSRAGKYQIQTFALDEVPDEYVLQLQTGLLVTGREWIDFISYSAGLPMYVKRVYPDLEMHAAIVRACRSFEGKVATAIAQFHATLKTQKYIPTERRELEEIVL